MEAGLNSILPEEEKSSSDTIISNVRPISGSMTASRGWSSLSLTSARSIFTGSCSGPISPSPTTLWLLKNGTILGINYAGSNYTGAAAIQYYQGSHLFTAWGSEQAFGQLLITEYVSASAYFQTTGTSTETLGPSTVSVTNYAANSLPETFPTCNGVMDTLTTASMSVGTPSGSNYPFATYVDVAGSGSTTTFVIVSQITSITVA